MHRHTSQVHQSPGIRDSVAEGVEERGRVWLLVDVALRVAERDRVRVMERVKGALGVALWVAVEGKKRPAMHAMPAPIPGRNACNDGI